MKYKPETYAKAVAELLKKTKSRDEEKKILGNFLKIAIRNGNIGTARRVLEKAQSILAKAGKGDVAVVEFARAISEKEQNRITSTFPKGSNVEIKISPALVAGTRITINGERELDASLASKLNRLFT